MDLENYIRSAAAETKAGLRLLGHQPRESWRRAVQHRAALRADAYDRYTRQRRWRLWVVLGCAVVIATILAVG